MPASASRCAEVSSCFLPSRHAARASCGTSRIESRDGEHIPGLGKRGVEFQGGLAAGDGGEGIESAMSASASRVRRTAGDGAGPSCQMRRAESGSPR